MAKQKMKASGVWLRLVTVVACAVASAGWTPSEWRELRGPGYEVHFPGNPSLKDLPFVLKALPLKLKLYSDEPTPGRLNWNFGFADLPASLANVSTQELLATDRAYATAISGKLVKQTELSLDGKVLGTETTVELKNGLRFIRRLYVNGGRLYQLGVVHPSDLDVAETFERFVASLKLSSPAQGGDGPVTITEASFSMELPGYADRTVHDLNIGGEPVVMGQHHVPPDKIGQSWWVKFLKLPPGMRPEAKAHPKQLLADFGRGLAGQGTVIKQRPVQLKSWKGTHHGLLVQLEHSDKQWSLIGVYLVGADLVALQLKAPKNADAEQIRALFERVADSIKPPRG